MTRRAFISLLGSAAAWPLTARAQQPERMRRIGVLTGLPESDPEARTTVALFRQGMDAIQLKRYGTNIAKWGIHVLSHP